jgi:hypothetical protein
MTGAGSVDYRCLIGRAAVSGGRVAGWFSPGRD